MGWVGGSVTASRLESLGKLSFVRKLAQQFILWFFEVWWKFVAESFQQFV